MMKRVETRKYQVRAVRNIEAALKRCHRVLAVAPTGSGKTVIGAALIKKQRGKRVLWLAHRIELLRQARTALIRAGIPKSQIGLLSGIEKENIDGRILIASVAMFRARQVPDVDLIVVDEAHHVAADSYRDIVDAGGGADVLGLTATPWRLDGEPLGDVFNDLIVVAESAELIADGYIMGSTVVAVPRDKARALVRGLVSSGADYSKSSLDQVMRKRPLRGDVVTEHKRLASGLPTLVYACNLEHGKWLVRRFRRAGITATFVDWQTPADERDAILGEGGKLARGEIEVVVNVGIVTEGVDCPPVKCIQIARPTKSLTLYRQMCGRASRPFGRRKPIVLDHAGNAWRHGLPDLPPKEPWSLDGRAVANTDVHREPNGEMREGAERDLREVQAQMERVRARQDELAAMRKRLAKIAKEKGAPSGWVERVMEAVA